MKIRLHPVQALYFAWLLAWRDTDIRDVERPIWKRIAYVCRYGRAAPFVWQMDGRAMDSYMEAVSELVEEENEKST